MDAAIKNGIIKKYKKYNEGISKVLLSLINGIDFEMLKDNSQQIDN